ncbi:MAG: M60 family metallopeptidase [Kistimonas sp.]|nr:M60 family metallopeptidase [Kistimonas sp.]
MFNNMKIQSLLSCICSLLMSTTCAATCAALWPFSSPEDAYRHLMPMGENFPGFPSTDAERVSRTIHVCQHPRDFSSLRLRIPPRHWQSTGLYRVPGEPVTVTMHSASGNLSFRERPFLRIGAHVQSLSKGWPATRVSCASYRFRLQEGTQQQDHDVTSGLIYIQFVATGAEEVDISISGAVKAPWFKLGRDSLKQWQNDIRYYPGPWAELEGKHAILTLPSVMIRDLDDPAAVIGFYDKIVEDVNALVGLYENADDQCDRAPDLPFRFVLDSAFPHINMLATSNFPINLNWIGHGDPFVWLTPGDPQVRAVLLHELGHNYEPDDRIAEPPGAQEAFANLIEYGYQSREGYWFLAQRHCKNLFYKYDDALYSYFPILMHPLFVASAYFTPARYDRRIWVDGGYVSWMPKNAFMIHLTLHLSYDFIADFYREFRHTPSNELPDVQDPQAKTDYFFETLCKSTQQDLTRFFESWSVPVSKEAYQRVSEKSYPIPAWLLHDEL